MMICPHCERAGSMAVTTALVINPIHGDGTIVGARARMPENPTALLSCRQCGWRVHGRLEKPILVGQVVTAGSFVQLEDPIVPAGRPT